ncbi:MAG: hypothetical protein PHP62_00310 [Candidatus Moranbacteria bacterium]|nr:hypothetical protein [Candidatus Moranbacteria bacterium]
MQEERYDFEETLVFIVDGREVILAPKMHKIGAGRYNGYGGKIEPSDPSIKFRAVEELWEEAWTLIGERHLQKVAEGYFINNKNDGRVITCKVNIFLAQKKNCIGTPTATEEMGEPESFDMDNMPYDNMMAADRYWLPEIFKGRKIIIRATMKNNQTELVGPVEIVDVKSFE